MGSLEEYKFVIDVAKVLLPLALIYFAWITSLSARQALFDKVHERVKELIYSANADEEKLQKKKDEALKLSQSVLKGYALRKQLKDICEIYKLDISQQKRGSGMTKWIGGLIVSGAILGGIFLLPDSPPLDKNAETINYEDISLTMSKNIWSTLPIIAQQKGYFKNEGLDVSVNYVQTAKFSMDALVAGQSDFSAVVDVNLAYLGYTGNKNVSVIATIVNAYDGGIIARKDRGIINPKDLKNKTIGILQGTTSQIFADNYLKLHGLSSSDVNIKNLSPISIQSSLVEGEIDAGSLWEPFIYNISAALGENSVVFKDPTAYTGYMNIAIRKDWGEHNKNHAISFLKALKNAQEYVKSNAQDSQEIIAKEIGVDLFVVKNIWSQYTFELRLDKNELLHQIVSEGEWIKETQDNFKPKDLPDFYERYIDTSYIGGIQ